ncbi:MAG: MBL fold metallo-hydrolase [Cyanobacteria bacterium]|nr:MBL fold metallo-hydrolase [Cyanobacteriota bacterium]
MKLKFIGVGGAFTDKYYQSNMVLDIGGQRMLIDCGSDARHAMRAAGLKLRDLEAIYISHLHADHAGGMEWASLFTYFDPGFVDAQGAHRKMKLYLRSSLKAELWRMLASGCCIPDVKSNLNTFFDVRSCPKNKPFEFAGVSFRTVQTVHYVNDTEIVPSYGLFWTTPSGKKVFLTTDTQFAPWSIRAFYKADIIFHDCETSPFTTGVHARYDDLKTLAPELRARMWLYHYWDGDLPDAQKDGFAGFVKQGQEFDLG